MGAETRLHESVIVAVARETHALLHGGAGQDFSILLGRVLAAAIRMVNESKWRLTLPDGKFQCVDNQQCFHVQVQRPTHDFPGEQIDQHRQVRELFSKSKVGLSRPGEFHPQPLREPDVNLSAHPTPITRTTREYAKFPVYE